MKMKRWGKLIGLFLILTLVIAGCGGQPASQGDDGAPAETYTLRLGWTTSDNESDPYAITAHQFKELVEAKSNGQITVSLHPNNELGDEREMIEGMSLGTIDMGVITNAPISGFVPQFQVLDLPFIFSSEEQAHRVLDGEVGQKLLSLLESQGIKGLGFAEGGFRHMINNVRPITNPADVSGIKFRVMNNPVYIGMFKALGGNATPMAWGEVFTAVQQKTVDGLEIPIPVIHQNKYYEVTRYLSLTRHTYSPLVVMISRQTWDKLPSDLQNAVEEAAAEAIQAERRINAENEASLLQDLKAKGMEVNEVENAAEFREKVLDVYSEFEGEIGLELMNQVLEAVQ